MKYQLSSTQLSTFIGDEVVVLDHQKGIYYSLDNVGATVWNKIQEKPHSLTEMTEYITDLYEVDYETCRSDIKGLLQELVSLKLANELPL
jgi:hypothetical protein